MSANMDSAPMQSLIDLRGALRSLQADILPGLRPNELIGLTYQLCFWSLTKEQSS